jgi:transcriptional regulator GlxA family with amidase domain
MNIQIVVFDGVDELDFVGPFEVFQRAVREAGGTTSLVTIGAVESITTSFGMKVTPHARLTRPVDLLLVPGGGWIGHADRGVRYEVEQGVLPEMIASVYREGAALAGVCTGCIALASAGVLNGRAAVTHAGALEDLWHSGANVIDARVVDDGDIITCGGVTAGLDLALWLVERFWGSDLAVKIGRQMEYSRSESIWTREAKGLVAATYDAAYQE